MNEAIDTRALQMPSPTSRSGRGPSPTAALPRAPLPGRLLQPPPPPVPSLSSQQRERDFLSWTETKGMDLSRGLSDWLPLSLIF